VVVRVRCEKHATITTVDILLAMRGEIDALARSAVIDALVVCGWRRGARRHRPGRGWLG